MTDKSRISINISMINIDEPGHRKEQEIANQILRCIEIDFIAIENNATHAAT